MIPFYLFKFHKFFDGILGYESMTELKISIDLLNKKLVLPNKTVDFEIRKYGPPEETINAQSAKFIKIPVLLPNDDVLVQKNLKINQIIIPSGVYKAKDGYIEALATNFGNRTTFKWTKPLKVVSFKNDYEIFHTQATIGKKLDTKEELNHLIRTSHLNYEEKSKLFNILSRHPNIIHRESEKLTCTEFGTHKINTTDEIPVHAKTYRYPHIHKPEVDKQINDMLADGIIQQSISPWISPIWVVPKKADSSGQKKWRIVVDYRKLNEKTIDDKFPIPNIEDILDKLGRSAYFTILDLKSGFHQIKVDPTDRQKTAFSTDKGHFEFIRMPFGLKNAPATFQRVMNTILKELIGKCCLVYLDDIIIFGSSLQQHIENLDKVLTRLTEANLKIQLDK